MDSGHPAHALAFDYAHHLGFILMKCVKPRGQLTDYHSPKWVRRSFSTGGSAILVFFCQPFLCLCQPGVAREVCRIPPGTTEVQPQVSSPPLRFRTLQQGAAVGPGLQPLAFCFLGLAGISPQRHPVLWEVIFCWRAPQCLLLCLRLTFVPD